MLSLRLSLRKGGGGDIEQIRIFVIPHRLLLGLLLLLYGLSVLLRWALNLGASHAHATKHIILLWLLWGLLLLDTRSLHVQSTKEVVRLVVLSHLLLRCWLLIHETECILRLGLLLAPKSNLYIDLHRLLLLGSIVHEGKCISVLSTSGLLRLAWCAE